MTDEEPPLWFTVVVRGILQAFLAGGLAAIVGAVVGRMGWMERDQVLDAIVSAALLSAGFSVLADAYRAWREVDDA